MQMNSSDAQQGQALVEVLVLATALVPLLLAVPLVAKYQDVRLAAIAASRTAAFECSARPDACGEEALQAAVADDLRRRHFSSHHRDLLSADGVPDGAPAEQRNRFWVDRRGGGLLAKPSDVSLGVATGRSDAADGASNRAAGGGAGGVSGAVGATSGLVGPGAFGLDVGGGLITSHVQARVSLNRTLAQWLQKPEGMRLVLTGKTAVLVDAWNATSGKGGEPRSLQSRLEQGRRLPELADTLAMFGDAAGASPAGTGSSIAGAGTEGAIDVLYAPIRTLITSPLLAPVEPRGSLFRYHEIDVDLIPADRIGEP